MLSSYNILNGGSNKNNIKDLMTSSKYNYTYPDPDDENFIDKIYKKREYYYHKIPYQKALKDYKDIKDYRDMVCGRDFALFSHQSFLSNFINPDTPYKGVLVFHGVGTGKTCSAVAIAEKFKNMVKKYNTKIHILTSGPLNKDMWKSEIVKCTKETYYKDVAINSGYIDPDEMQKLKKNAIGLALQYYKIMSYKSFYKKVLGEKIIEKSEEEDNNKIKNKYRRNELGEIERDLAVDKIDNLNNTLLIIDEAHNLTGNEYGEAVQKIIDNSKNLKVILLSATPMKNLGEDIIPLLNFLRPINQKIEPSKIFQPYNKNYEIELKSGGLEYLQKMASGYISYFRGANPLIFAERIDEGEIPEGLIFTKVVRCKMLKFQLDAYNNAIEYEGDALDRKSGAVANFVFPGLSEDKKSIVGYYGKSGMNTVRTQLKTNNKLFLDKLNEKFFGGKYKEIDKLYYDVEKSKSLSGSIYQLENLKHFSIKFYTALKNINDLVAGKKEPGTAFIYSNLVTVGIDLFKEVLLQNGYLEYDESGSGYTINDDTICYYCGKTSSEHKQISKHQFSPAIFITVTGQSEDGNENIPEEKKKILDNVFNNIENKEGKYIKLLLGSKVMNEGITLENVKDVHIIDVHYNLGKVHQAIGRAIRQCKHYKVTTEDNPNPKVSIFKYVVSLDKGLSTEEQLYQKAEKKYILVKKIERALKEVAIDCPINYHGNIFPEEVDKYSKCIPLDEYKGKGTLCPEMCDFTHCEFVCKDKKLNLNYYDKNRKIYNRITKNELDYTTFTNALARDEIEYAKTKIKELYKYKYVYKLEEIIEYVKNSYSGEKKDLFDDFFVLKGLDELVPISENDFNNFKDTIYDKFGVAGYLIYRNVYYIFQPFDQNEDVPMYYRSKYNKQLRNDLTVYNYLKNKTNNENIDIDEDTQINNYDFETTKEYYDNRKENKIIGIIDRGGRGKSIKTEDDVFKIRLSRDKLMEKNKSDSIPSLKGAVCNTSNSKEELFKLARSYGISPKNNQERTDVCFMLKDKMLYNEKYATDKDGNKITYIMIPANHKLYEFPYNLEDRIKYTIDNIKNETITDITISKKKEGNGIFNGKREQDLPRYILTIDNDKKYKNLHNLFTKYGFKLDNNKWTKIIE